MDFVNVSQLFERPWLVARDVTLHLQVDDVLFLDLLFSVLTQEDLRVRLLSLLWIIKLTCKFTRQGMHHGVVFLLIGTH